MADTAARFAELMRMHGKGLVSNRTLMSSFFESSPVTRPADVGAYLYPMLTKADIDRVFGAVEAYFSDERDQKLMKLALHLLARRYALTGWKEK